MKYLLSLLLCFNVFAEELSILSLTASKPLNVNDHHAQVVFKIDQDIVQDVCLDLYKDSYARRKCYGIPSLGQYIKVLEFEGKEILSLRVDYFYPESGGQFHLKYMHNILKNEHREEMLWLDKRNGWSFMDKWARPIWGLHFETRLQGIKRIDFRYR